MPDDAEGPCYVALMSHPDLTKLPEAELRRLQDDNPPDNADASNPKNDYARAILAEGARRGYWKSDGH